MKPLADLRAVVVGTGFIGLVHLEALRRAPGDLVRLYAALARKTVEVALRKGKIGRRPADQILALLAEGEGESSAGTLRG